MEAELFRLNLDEECTYLGLVYNFFNAIVILINNNVFLMVWLIDSLFFEDYLAFRFGGQHYSSTFELLQMDLSFNPLSKFH